MKLQGTEKLVLYIQVSLYRGSKHKGQKEIGMMVKEKVLLCNRVFLLSDFVNFNEVLL